MSVLSRLAAAAAVAVALSGCGGGSSGSSGKADAAHPMELTLAHGLSETHTVHIAMKNFAREVEEKTGGRIRIRIFANGQLGNETEQMEQVMAGVISMTKVSAPMLATYDDAFHAFGLPYVFADTADFYKVMNSPRMYEFFQSTYPDGFVVLTYYTSGARSFYTPSKAIREPSDLKGMKIRVMDMKSQTEMVRLMGGTPVAMAYGDVYTSLQTGVIDGTENNETALTTGKHGEICKVYSVDQHAMIPDVLLISSKVWDRISDSDRQIIVKAAAASTQAHAREWDKAVAQAVEEAQDKMGVTFVRDVDKEAFRKATAPMLKTYSDEYPGVRKMLSLITSIREGK